jgi:hypothetical protein
VLLPCQQAKLARGAEYKEHAMSSKLDTAIATVIGMDIGKNARLFFPFRRGFRFLPAVDTRALPKGKTAHTT